MFLVVLFALCLAVSVSSQQTAGGRIAAACFFGVLLAVSLAGWFRVRRVRRQLEVGRDVIVSRRGAKGRQPFTLTADPGDTLRLLPQFKLYSRVRQPRLIFLGRGGYLLLGGFSLGQVRRACEAQGWRFDGDPALAVRDVQSWLHRGLSVEAAQLLQLFGPFPDASADGEPRTALEAAVFEDIGDKFAGRARANARDAYQRAAAAQGAFAARAASPGEGAERRDEADRIDGKARS
ncbi:MAG TPA: hypothetical protein VGD91_19345 [Trebonia sp.]